MKKRRDFMENNVKEFNKMTDLEAVGYINIRYEADRKATLDTVAKELGVTRGKLYSCVQRTGHKLVKRQYIAINSNKETTELDVETLNYLFTKTFNKQITARVSEDTYSNFIDLCATKYPNVPITKIISLALEQFSNNNK